MNRFSQLLSLSGALLLPPQTKSKQSMQGYIYPFSTLLNTIQQVVQVVWLHTVSKYSIFPAYVKFFPFVETV